MGSVWSKGEMEALAIWTEQKQPMGYASWKPIDCKAVGCQLCSRVYWSLSPVSPFDPAQMSVATAGR
uniref:Uncharacterized protein n=1 Tax=Arundo donax TaxID=35708 RepID=A0A0A9AZ91_ARUDO